MKVIQAKVKLKKPIEFWYALKNVAQPDLFDPSRTIIGTEYVGEGHIVKNGMLMCKQGRDLLEKKYKADRTTKRERRIDGVPVCRACEEAYKIDSNLAWAKWVQNAKETAK